MSIYSKIEVIILIKKLFIAENIPFFMVILGAISIILGSFFIPLPINKTIGFMILGSFLMFFGYKSYSPTESEVKK